MLYQLYETQRSLMEPFSDLAAAAAKVYANPLVPAGQSELLHAALKTQPHKVPAPVKKAILAALSERDASADICLDAKGKPEPDADLRDTETVPLPQGIALPLPLGFDNETGHDKLLALVKTHCENYLKAEVLPHVPDAWIDHSKTKVGYEIPFNRHFYEYKPPRDLAATMKAPT